MWRNERRVVVLTTVASTLVGVSRRSMRRSLTMAEGQRMTVADVVAETHDGRLDDCVREAVVLGRARVDGG
jgi:hypothetical protein